MSRRFIASYRLQLHKDFGLEEVREVASYLFDLGVSHLYLSPILESVSGSLHGYDVTDPVKISKERGGEKQWRKLLKYLNEEFPDRGIIVDIVPNHVGAGWENPYWRNLLENGPSSPYFELFDIHARDLAEGDSSDRGGHELRLVLPVLGSSLKECLSKEELAIDLDETGFFVRYWDNRFPLAAGSYANLVESFLEKLADPLDEASQTRVAELGREFAELPNWSQTLSPQERWRRHLHFVRSKKALWSLMSEDTEIQASLREHLSLLESDELKRLLKAQPYELAFWKEGALRINYRRFFDITDLAALRVEDGQVFDFTHTKVAEIAKERAVDGLRIDHVDGLWNPRQYLSSLHRVCPNIWVEKILGPHESLPADWPVLGCTGYEFMNAAGALFVSPEGFKKIETHFRENLDLKWSGFAEAVKQCKTKVFENFFQSEWKRLTDELSELAEENEFNLSREEIATSLRDITVALPVYRTYLEAVFGGSEQDRRFLAHAFESWRSWGEASEECIGFFEDAFTGRLSSGSPNLQQWIYRWQQLSGPVMAKGLEDTCFYRDYPLVALNEVGGEGALAMAEPVEHWQDFINERILKQPLAMNGTSSHDTKRSESVRCRLASLSDQPGRWIEYFEKYSESHRELCKGEGGKTLITRHELWFIYQNLLASWPVDGELDETYCGRMKAYFEKAFREAKLSTSWRASNEEWEGQLARFLEAILEDSQSEFARETLTFAADLKVSGALKEMSLLALKCLAPGIPDFYQGTELWDDSLVDPDNRRPVDYSLRRELLAEVKSSASRKDGDEFLEEMLTDWHSGALKLWMTWRILRWLKLHDEPIERFRPCVLKGEDAPNFIAYLRESHSENVLLILPVRSKEGSVGLAPRDLGLKADFGTMTGLGVVVEDILRSTQSSEVDIAKSLTQFPLGLFAWRK